MFSQLNLVAAVCRHSRNFGILNFFDTFLHKPSNRLTIQLNDYCFECYSINRLSQRIYQSKITARARRQERSLGGDIHRFVVAAPDRRSFDSRYSSPRGRPCEPSTPIIVSSKYLRSWIPISTLFSGLGLDDYSPIFAYYFYRSIDEVRGPYVDSGQLPAPGMCLSANNSCLICYCFCASATTGFNSYSSKNIILTSKRRRPSTRASCWLIVDFRVV